MFRRVNISAALIVLICFFLPWEQVSCGGAQDSLSGFDLARHQDALLWLIPLLMLAVLIFGLLRRRSATPQGLGVLGLVSGSAASYLMNGERMRVNDASTIISARLTGWFWLGLISSLLLAISGIVLLFRKQRVP